ncbi:MAG: hypothetical protein A2204_03955 [Elusimicrobia bacterium RIFOXYA1_FULL_47_7]|nr:MAG: hypothetical protein A2278_02840 [Elusimicrobia bacterium RIFOXYA12_FULL_49_49]OGS07184.1 MAG: hypothetical protein A2204_03955 [Elusimicrobia bacterium RIFOXYA1_FULL_47_7]OGS16418.1 MAG: hypothetical protein A2251_06295 [Elusimicrobia bacterium RIFOXYA2_FULL_47_53]OGS27206.1 MAG: hypothetical protein A2339_07885 [Elusimicrobia bacterium RIFOXYB12_FULL_50_12]OGS30405.1 MAG: hypothetical protein A2323_02745 [Elusimicrobia bacterium RIFOXYB2_FULL_46_23]
MKRAVFVFLALIQVTAILVSDIGYLKGMDFSARQDLAPAAMKSSLSPVLAVVNANFSGQLKFVSALIDFAADAGKKTMPKPRKEEQAPQQCKIYSPAPSYNGDLKNVFLAGPFINSPIEASAQARPGLILAGILALIFLKARRLKLHGFFFLLPRGSIDDYISGLIAIFPFNPHCCKATGVFSCPLSRANNVKTERGHVW